MAVDDNEKWEANSKHTIEELFVFISKDADGGESIVMVQGKAGWFPLIGSDLDRAKSLRPFAETVAERFGRTVQLVRFSGRKDLTRRHMPSLIKDRGTWK